NPEVLLRAVPPNLAADIVKHLMRNEIKGLDTESYLQKLKIEVRNVQDQMKAVTSLLLKALDSSKLDNLMTRYQRVIEYIKFYEGDFENPANLFDDLIAEINDLKDVAERELSSDDYNSIKKLSNEWVEMLGSLQTLLENSPLKPTKDKAK